MYISCRNVCTFAKLIQILLDDFSLTCSKNFAYSKYFSPANSIQYINERLVFLAL